MKLCQPKQQKSNCVRLKTVCLSAHSSADSFPGLILKQSDRNTPRSHFKMNLMHTAYEGQEMENMRHFMTQPV